MDRRIGPDITTTVIAMAEESGREVAALPIEEIAARLGVSRATLYRRIGSREALHGAVRAEGVEPGERPDVRERAIQAAAAIVRSDGLGALTLERVAAEADCSVPALHQQLGGREGLLAALFERYHPLVPIERFLTVPPATFRDGVRAIYGILFGAATAEPRLLGALVADTLARPDGPTATLVREKIVPRALGSVGRWLAGEIAGGRCRPMPLPILLQLLAAPMIAHAASRDFVARMGLGNPPPRETTVELFTDAFCRAVALPPPDTAIEAGSPQGEETR
jgi:AcrR family transcriptional regulator